MLQQAIYLTEQRSGSNGTIEIIGTADRDLKVGQTLTAIIDGKRVYFGLEAIELGKKMLNAISRGYSAIFIVRPAQQGQEAPQLKKNDWLYAIEGSENSSQQAICVTKKSVNPYDQIEITGLAVTDLVIGQMLVSRVQDKETLIAIDAIQVGEDRFDAIQAGQTAVFIVRPTKDESLQIEEIDWLYTT